MSKHAQNIVKQKFIFQQNNSAVYTARDVQAYCRMKVIDILLWPVRSPDRNIIENRWQILSREIYSRGKQGNSVQNLSMCVC